MRTIFLRESGQQWWSHLDLFYLSFVRTKRVSPNIYKPAKLSWLLWLSLSLCLELHSVSVYQGFFFSLKKMKNGLQRDINQGAHCWPVFKDSYWDLTVTSWNGEMAKSACASLMIFTPCFIARFHFFCRTKVRSLPGLISDWLTFLRLDWCYSGCWRHSNSRLKTSVVTDVEVGVEESLVWRQIRNVWSELRVSLFIVCYCSGSSFGNALNPRVHCAFD